MDALVPDSPDAGSRKRSTMVRGELLRSLRVSRGWTQAEAGRLAGLSDRLIRKAEAGGLLDMASVRALATLYQAPEEAITSASRPHEPGLVTDDAQLTPAARLARRFLEDKWKALQGKSNEDPQRLFEEALLPEFTFHMNIRTVSSREELYQHFVEFLQSFSDVEMVAEQVIDHGDFVVARWRCSMTHTGPWHDLAPTHRRVTVYGASWVRVVDGRFGDGWDFWDPGLLYQQLAAPEPPGTDPNSP